MEETKQFQESKRLTTEGENGIVTKLKKEAGKKLLFQMNTITVPGKKLKEICDLYEKTKRMVDRQPDGTKENLKAILNRLKRSAKAMILKSGEVNGTIMDLFGFRQIDFPARELMFRKYLIEYVINGLKSDNFFNEAIKEFAKTGHHVDYSLAKDLIIQLSRLIEVDKEYPDNEPLEEKSERNREICELSDQVTAELYLRNKEKSKRPNLCYFLLADENGILKHGSTVNSEEKETERVNSEVTLYLISRIQNLSKTNLIELIRIFCKANNEFYKTFIDSEKMSKTMKKNKDAYKHKRFFTPEDTRGLVRLYKDDGLSNKQIAEKTGFKLRTVERYSTN